MGKSLVIVESPAKARTINKYLGRNFIVKSSVGHIRDLPVSGSGKKVDGKARAKAAAYTRALPPKKRAAHKKKKAQQALIARMGVDPEKGWKANYEILPGKEKVVTELRRLAKDADTVYLATDLDREGEAIAWHLREVIGGDDSRFKRVVFNEITKSAIRQAFEEPGSIDQARVNAQQARRFLDRVVGYMLSPLLWSKVARGLSAGRVQSVAVRLLVEREREIHAFVPEEFWELYADTVRPETGEPLRLQAMKRAGEEFRPTSQADSDSAMAVLREHGLGVAERNDKPTKTKPSAPYITSTLQQAASTRLGFSVKKTMMLAQRLYEAGHITYMRTDSTNLSAEAVQACREHIGEHYGERYLPEEALSYASSDGAQEAHEAIRPSNVNVEPGSIGKLERDQQRVYEMIWKQFVACQMPPAEYLSTNVVVRAGDFELRKRGRILVFDGYTKVQPPTGKGDKNGPLPDVQVGEVLKLVQLDPVQHFTKPPPRYGEASLVKELEKRGIGRPSTYASIISTIQDRGYVRLENRRFHAEKIGDIVIERLMENFGELMDFGFTAELEESLDEIAIGKKKWKNVLSEFYKDFKAKIEEAGAEIGGMRTNEPTDTDIDCPACGRALQVRTASTGVFLGCSGYALPPKERCKSTINLISGEEAVSADAEDQEEGEARLLLERRHCPKCKTSMDSYLIDETRKLHVCGNNPDCAGFEVEQGQFVIKGYDGPVLECDKCGADMQLKSGRFGKYFGCTRDECKNTRKLLRSGEPAPPKVDPIPMPHLLCEKCDDFYLLRDGAAGIFLAASQFPKHRETRAPLVEEIVVVKDQLDDKYRFLADAPGADPEGNKAMVRFLRKTKEQYVMTEVDGKATGWRAYMRDGRWVEEIPEKKKAPGRKVAAKTKTPRKRKGSAAKSPGRAVGVSKSGRSASKTARKRAKTTRKRAASR
jgi:DNA topoisomerase-1